MAAPTPASPSPPTVDVTVLKNVVYGVDRGPLPYRIDHLRTRGLRLHWTDLPYRRALRRFHDPSLQTLALAPRLLRHPATLAMFESSAHPWGLVRDRVPAARRSAFVVLSCWLAELLVAASPDQLARYRRAYRTVDRLFAFSANQVPLLADLLDLEPGRVRALRFGVDHREFRPAGPGDGPILAVGRDRGRDWPTLLAALAATGTPAQVLCRPADIAGLAIPANVEVLGPVGRERYRALLQRARAVLVCTHVLAYPTGQSVLLEAMACGRAVVATDTPALADYVEPGRTALTVAPSDVDGWAEAVRAIERHEVDLALLGATARAAVEEGYTADAMWAEVADHLHHLVGGARDA